MRLGAIAVVMYAVLAVLFFSFIGCAVQRAEAKPVAMKTEIGIEFLDGPPTENVPHVCNFFETPDGNGNIGKCMSLRSYAIQYAKARREAEHNAEGEAVDHL